MVQMAVSSDHTEIATAPIARDSIMVELRGTCPGKRWVYPLAGSPMGSGVYCRIGKIAKLDEMKSSTVLGMGQFQ